MRNLLGIGAVVLGVVGVLVCATAGGIGWWGAVRTTARLDRVIARLDSGLSDVDAQLARVESWLNAVRTDLNAVRGAAETIAAENPDLPRVRAEIERLLDRLVPALDRVDALAIRSGRVPWVSVPLRTSWISSKTIPKRPSAFGTRPRRSITVRSH
jgi:NAD(P)-dependent dehydrogenase (short-subunit alcohol dehydrogenase family)